LDADGKEALAALYATTPLAKELAPKTKGILVFPGGIKAGLIIGGQFGNGVMYSGDQAVGYFNTTAASYGLQAGAQKYGYALYFMAEKSLEYLKKSAGWEVGIGPILVVVDGASRRHSQRPLQRTTSMLSSSIRRV
jgi:lipid-binding SYLF domain-containing protein